MRNSKLAIVAVVLVILFAVGDCWGGPPTTKSDTQWYNPTTWQWPTVPWGQEPARIRKKSPNVLSQMNQSAKRGWAKTKQVFSPSKISITDAKPASSKSKPGFWESLFGPSQPSREVRTVNDFLSQPHPR